MRGGGRSRARWVGAMMIVVGAGLVLGCSEPSTDEASMPSSGSGGSSIGEVGSSTGAGSYVDAPPAGANAARFAALAAHEPFGFGTPASAARIARWDIDVKPDGEGLPEGSGTVAEGRAVYETNCVSCHGPTGVEGPNDRLVSTEPWGEGPPSQRTIGNYWPYATTLFDFISKAMPQATPGILTADQTYAVIAYLLYLNELWPEDGVLDRTTLPAIEMPARDRFVPDDRTGGREVR